MDEQLQKFRERCAKHLKEINWQLEDIRWRICALIWKAENEEARAEREVKERKKGQNAPEPVSV